MNYYHVQVTDNDTRTFVVRAKDRDTAMDVLAENNADNMRQVYQSTANNIETTEADIAAWNDAGRKLTKKRKSK